MSVVELMAAMPSIVRIERPTKNGDWILFPKAPGKLQLWKMSKQFTNSPNFCGQNKTDKHVGNYLPPYLQVTSKEMNFLLLLLFHLSFVFPDENVLPCTLPPSLPPPPHI